MLTASELLLMRLDRVVRQRLVPAVSIDRRPVSLAAWAVGGEPVPFADALRAEYAPFPVGARWGTAWDTVWFRVAGTVPANWKGRQVEVQVDLGFDDAMPGFQAEATARHPDGTIIKGIEPRNAWIPVPDEGDFEFYLEAAANPNIAGRLDFTPTSLGDGRAVDADPLYTLARIELVLRDDEVAALVHDITALRDLAVELHPGSARAAVILHGLSRAVDALDPDDIAASAPSARAVLRPLLAAPASATAHRIAAVGHAHIDSAWLWPTRETVRKVARTFSNVLDLIGRHPDLTFVASSAQQYAWLKDAEPELFARVQRAVQAGRMVPVGGMWVESDTNMPSGEALVRQFAEGIRFFEEEFGVRPREVWLPDSFGYSPSLPQIARMAGMRWMLTQKMSWNETNVLPHHSFFWEGIDGSRLFTHFPPQDTYNGVLSAAELALTERQHADKAFTNRSLAPFGWGDGGGGPTREMLEMAARYHDLEGSPRVEHSAPAAFFIEAEQEADPDAVWVGEMYLELHRGTLTSQTETKRGNRRSEALLAEAELWSTTAAVVAGLDYPHDELQRIWRMVLLHQFHDILPGSSIGWVHREAEAAYARIAEELDAVIDRALTGLVGTGSASARADGLTGAITVSPPAGSETPWVAPEADGGGFVLDGPVARAVIDARGVISSLNHRPSDREVIPVGAAGGVLQLFHDTPRQWDAWDIDDEDTSRGRDLVQVESIGPAPDGDGVVVRRIDGASTYLQTIRMDRATGAVMMSFEIDWREREKLLKLSLPLDIRADHATSEIQFGHVSRPIHRNTSWDAARFETVAHRWIHVGEPGFGVAVLNDGIYGHDARITSVDARSGVVLRPSLLRAPLFPDPQADQGVHRFTVALLAGSDIATAGEAARRMQTPIRTVQGRPGTALRPLVTVDGAGVVVTAVKSADDRSGDVVVRFHEALGGRAAALLRPTFAWVEAALVDALEDPTGELIERTDDGGVRVALRPFAIRTMRFRRRAASPSGPPEDGAPARKSSDTNGAQ